MLVCSERVVREAGLEPSLDEVIMSRAAGEEHYQVQISMPGPNGRMCMVSEGTVST
jgi:hypothetical protein